MPLALNEKKLLVAEIKENLAKNGMAIFAEFKSQKVSEVSDMRNKLYDGQVSYKVYKNTLIKRALSELDPDNEEMKKLFVHLKGATAMAYSVTKPLEAAKMMTDFAKGNEKVNVKCGFFEGTFIDGAGVEQLASIGSKEMLIGRLVNALKSPVSRLANSLKSPASKLAYTLSAVADQKEKSAG